MAEASFGWDALRWAWNNRTEILGLVRGIREWWKSDPGRSILVIGCGGVGKTTLAAILSGEFDWLLSEPWRYNESFGIEASKLKDDAKTSILVSPGQAPRREDTWADVEQGLVAGRYRGVIVVNAYGYHNWLQSYKAHALYEGSKDKFLTEYLPLCRTDEVALMKRVCGAARTVSQKLWMLSVIAKEDLWWPNRQNVAQYYSTGEYTDAVTELAIARGQQRFRHELIPASLVINNFLTGENEVLSRNAEGYDHKQQVMSVRRPFEVLNALRDWEVA